MASAIVGRGLMRSCWVRNEVDVRTLPREAACLAVRNKRRIILEALESGQDRHGTMVRAVAGLRRMARGGHCGVSPVLEEINVAFTAARSHDGPGAAAKAAAEWRRALQGAEKKFGSDRRADPFACCPCTVRDLRRAVNAGIGITSGRAGANQRKLMRFVLDRAEVTGSLRIRGEPTGHRNQSGAEAATGLQDAQATDRQRVAGAR